MELEIAAETRFLSEQISHQKQMLYSPSVAAHGGPVCNVRWHKARWMRTILANLTRGVSVVPSLSDRTGSLSGGSGYSFKFKFVDQPHLISCRRGKDKTVSTGVTFGRLARRLPPRSSTMTTHPLPFVLSSRSLHSCAPSMMRIKLSTRSRSRPPIRHS